MKALNLYLYTINYFGIDYDINGDDTMTINTHTLNHNELTCITYCDNEEIPNDVYLNLCNTDMTFTKENIQKILEDYYDYKFIFSLRDINYNRLSVEVEEKEYEILSEMIFRKYTTERREHNLNSLLSDDSKEQFSSKILNLFKCLKSI